jgi:hypothetical protein
MIRQIIIAAVLVAMTTHADMEWETAIGQKDQVTRGLVAYWAMRNSGTTVYDEIGANNGTATGSPTFSTTNAAVGYGVSFGASSDIYTNTANWQSSDSAGTISAWAMLTTATNGELQVFSSSDTASIDYFVLVQMFNNLGARIVQNGGSTVDVVHTTTWRPTPNTWHHIAFVSSGSAWSIWCDGVNRALTVTLGSNTGDWFSDTARRDNWCISALRRSSVVYSPSGSKVDEVRIYNRALTDDEIKQLYRMGAIPKGIK